MVRGARRPPLEAGIQCARTRAAMMVGIDLGTTNSALAFLDPAEADGTSFPPIRLLEIPQLVDEGRVEARSLLPSFLYLGEERSVGVYAREQAALVPTRVVTSAK